MSAKVKRGGPSARSNEQVYCSQCFENGKNALSKILNLVFLAFKEETKRVYIKSLSMISETLLCGINCLDLCEKTN